MHKLLSGQPGEKVLLLGNEAIARGAIEAGLAFASTYPGTPSSEISSNFFEVAQQGDLYFEYSTNEKVAMEVAAAAANSGVRSMCVMKHVGVNVAADALMAIAYVGVKADMVIVSADDPFMFSSQNEQDNRYYGKLAGTGHIKNHNKNQPCPPAPPILWPQAGEFTLTLIKSRKL